MGAGTAASGICGGERLHAGAFCVKSQGAGNTADRAGAAVYGFTVKKGLHHEKS